MANVLDEGQVWTSKINRKLSVKIVRFPSDTTAAVVFLAGSHEGKTMNLKIVTLLSEFFCD